MIEESSDHSMNQEEQQEKDREFDPGNRIKCRSQEDVTLSLFFCSEPKTFLVDREWNTDNSRGKESLVKEKRSKKT